MDLILCKECKMEREYFWKFGFKNADRVKVISQLYVRNGGMCYSFRVLEISPFLPICRDFYISVCLHLQFHFWIDYLTVCIYVLCTEILEYIYTQDPYGYHLNWCAIVSEIFLEFLSHVLLSFLMAMVRF